MHIEMCSRVPCPTGWGTRIRATLALHYTQGESPNPEQVGGRGYQHLNPGIQTASFSNQPTSSEASIVQREVSDSREGSAYIKTSTHPFGKTTTGTGSLINQVCLGVEIGLISPAPPSTLPLSPARHI